MSRSSQHPGTHPATVTFGEITEDRCAGPLRRCRPLQEQLGKSRRASKQHRQGPDARLDAAYRRFVGKGKRAALDQSRQGALVPPFAATLTTIAFDDSSLQWFDAC